MLRPTEFEGERARAEARRMFRRVLAGWASDVLDLRRRGLDRAVRRSETRGMRVRRAA